MSKNNPAAEIDLDAELSSLIGDINESPVTNAVVEEVIEIEASDSDLAQIEAELSADDVRAEAYAEQPAEQPIAPAEDESPTGKKAPKTKAPRTSSVTPITGLKPSEALTRSLPEEELLKVAMLTFSDTADSENASSVLNSLDKLAKKVGQKAINVLRFADSPGRIEGYVQKGLSFLLSETEAGREVTCGAMYQMLRNAGYTDGTARSQSSQLNVLFPALKIATLEGRVLKPNSTSTVLDRYTKASAASSAVAA